MSHITLDVNIQHFIMLWNQTHIAGNVTFIKFNKFVKWISSQGDFRMENAACDSKQHIRGNKGRNLRMYQDDVSKDKDSCN